MDGWIASFDQTSMARKENRSRYDPGLRCSASPIALVSSLNKKTCARCWVLLPPQQTSPASYSCCCSVVFSRRIWFFLLFYMDVLLNDLSRASRKFSGVEWHCQQLMSRRPLERQNQNDSFQRTNASRPRSSQKRKRGDLSPIYVCLDSRGECGPARASLASWN